MSVALVIIDGAGLAPPDAIGNAVKTETLPTLFGVMQGQGYATLQASGAAVGLDASQTGNSEVGHLTIGAGSAVPSDLARISRAASDGNWAEHKLWHSLSGSPRLHIVGLVSDAGTHGHWSTIAAAAQLARQADIGVVVVHLVLDGVDSLAGSAINLLDRLYGALRSIDNVRFGLVIGRRWFCDRSGDLAVTRIFADALWSGSGATFTLAALDAHLARATEDSFAPHVHEPGCAPLPGEPILLTQNRADRAVQSATILAERNRVYTLIDIDGTVDPSRVFFPPRPLDSGIAFELIARGKTSARISEKCKFPHVTYFFNGRNPHLEGDEICLPSVQEAHLAAHPEMSAAQIADAAVDVISRGQNDLLVVNIPNLDQIGHLGSYDLAVAAAAYVDCAVAKIRNACVGHGWAMMITSDHGNADRVLDDSGRPFTSHTERPVPFSILPPPGRRVRWHQRTGCLSQVAATVLMGLDLPVPEQMAEGLASIV